MALFHWHRGFDCAFILSTINGFRRPVDKGCSFDGTKHQFWLPILQSAVRADDRAHDLKARCVSKAVNDPTLKLGNPDDFLARCERAFTELTKAAQKRYTLFCTTTYNGPKLVGLLRDGQCEIQWQPSGSSTFFKAADRVRDDLFKKHPQPQIMKIKDGLTPILVHVNAHSPQDAYDLAVRSVDCLRGLLNFYINSGRSLNVFAKFFGRDAHAVNRFRPGPYSTVHKEDGSLATSTIWYEPRWSHEKPTIRFDGDWRKNRTNITRSWARLQSNPLRQSLVEGFVRYCRALDQHDTDAALLGLWSALEYLTGTQFESYERTVARVSKLFDDHVEARQIAQHLRIRRNSTVHSGRSPESNEVDTVILQAERLVGQLLSFYMSDGRKFVSQAELIEFLDLDVDEYRLNRRRALIAHFIAYRKRT